MTVLSSGAPPGQAPEPAGLPAAGRAQVRRAALAEIRADRGTFAAMLVLNALAAAAGLVAPRLLGSIVDTVKATPGAAAIAAVDRLALLIGGFTVLQIILSRYALHVGARFGERAAARIRERFTERALGLPPSIVEHVPAGDLVTRGTADIGAVAVALRTAAPEVSVSAIQATLILAAVISLHPLFGLCALAGLAVITLALRWYLRRARAAYLAEGAATSDLTEVLTSTAAGARTVEALGLRERRLAQTETAIVHATRTRLATLRLRTGLFPVVDVMHVAPLFGVLLIGGALLQAGAVSLGVVITAALYLRQLVWPLDTLLLMAEQLQQSSASYARVEGLTTLGSADPPVSAGSPSSDRIVVSDCRFAYPNGREVLHGVDLDIAPGERLAVVGPSGAGKSTLGRLLAGLEAPLTGSVTVGGVPVADLSPEHLRRQVVLVTQEHHVFLDTLRGNLLLADPAATDDRLHAALASVGASGWATDLDAELAEHALTGAQAQQLALARVILADPHTLILDEATALLDPTAARDTERALSAVLQGRTVIAIAHRLQTAHDADRIAVMEHGRITELGTHHELVAADGAYAALWHSWHGD